MKSISEIVEELQIDFPEIELFDVDSFNGHPALTYLGQNSSLFIYTEDENVMVFLENDITGEDIEYELINEEDVYDLYQELANVIQWAISTKLITADKNEYKTILRDLAKYGIEPNLSFSI